MTCQRCELDYLHEKLDMLWSCTARIGNVLTFSEQSDEVLKAQRDNAAEIATFKAKKRVCEHVSQMPPPLTSFEYGAAGLLPTVCSTNARVVEENDHRLEAPVLTAYGRLSQRFDAFEKWVESELTILKETNHEEKRHPLNPSYGESELNELLLRVTSQHVSDFMQSGTKVPFVEWIVHRLKVDDSPISHNEGSVLDAMPLYRLTNNVPQALQTAIANDATKEARDEHKAAEKSPEPPPKRKRGRPRKTII